MMKKETISKIKTNELPFGIELSQFVYFIFAIGGTLAMTAHSLLIREFDFEYLWNLISVCIFWILFYGTYKIKAWVVTPVLVYSAFGSFHSFLEFLSFHPADKAELAKKGFQILMLSFFLFQLFIFSRKKTKDFYKEKGTIVVS
jgi:hypothetical protein